MVWSVVPRESSQGETDKVINSYPLSDASSGDLQLMKRCNGILLATSCQIGE